MAPQHHHVWERKQLARPGSPARTWQSGKRPALWPEPSLEETPGRAASPARVGVSAARRDGTAQRVRGHRRADVHGTLERQGTVTITTDTVPSWTGERVGVTPYTPVPDLLVRGGGKTCGETRGPASPPGPALQTPLTCRGTRRTGVQRLRVCQAVGP